MVEEARELLQKDLGIEISNWGKNSEAAAFVQAETSKILQNLSANNPHLSYLSKTLVSKNKKPTGKKRKRKQNSNNTGNTSAGSKKPNLSNGNFSSCSKKPNLSNGNFSSDKKIQNSPNEIFSEDKKKLNLSNGNNDSTGAKKVHKYQITVPKEAKKAIMKNEPWEVEKVLKSTPVSKNQPVLKNNNNISFDISAQIEDIFDEEEVKSDEKKKKKRVSWGDNTEHSPVKIATLEG